MGTRNGPQFENISVKDELNLMKFDVLQHIGSNLTTFT